MRQVFKQTIVAAFSAIGLLILVIAYNTYNQWHDVARDFKAQQYQQIAKPQILDSQNNALTITYQNRWNIHDQKSLYEIPELLQRFFIYAEDQRFYQHNGIDWIARLHAIWQNINAGRIIRGASTISEQVVRILKPRPRRLWSRWLETWEALSLEQQINKADILNFYLNQVPYGSQQRGVVQAARYYFNRDLNTLNIEEMLALAVLVRSPSRLDLHKNPRGIKKPLKRLALRLQQQAIISLESYQQLGKQPLKLQKYQLPIQAAHFSSYLLKQKYKHLPHAFYTSLDSNLQRKTQAILNQRLAQLAPQQVHNGAVLIIDHHTQQVLAWVNGGDYFSNQAGSQIDAIITPRQPGSTLKPLLYAAALDAGWTAATLIKDAPLVVSIGTGLHNYHNYSFQHYGMLRLRDALGNSLNTPAVRTLQFVGVAAFLQTLKKLGMDSLTATAAYYGNGLALGNGAVSLFELTQAYTSLARQGYFQNLQLLREQDKTANIAIFSRASSSIIANILSDSDARRLEFGRNSILNLPYQTAVKTGTSNDYHDAWTLGFNHHYTVGVWMGNLDQTPMHEVSGAIGPALVLRSVFAELNRNEQQQALYLDPSLKKLTICREDGQMADKDCQQRQEWFAVNTYPNVVAPVTTSARLAPKILQWLQPRNGLQMAKDPRIPDQKEVFLWKVIDDTDSQQYTWILNQQIIATTDKPEYAWQVQVGKHQLYVKNQTNDGIQHRSDTIHFWVKGRKQ